MQQERPVNLNLLKFHFPVMAIVSVLHRITGVVLFLFVPALLYILHASLVSEATFHSLRILLWSPLSKIVLLMVLASTIYHLFAGIRHLVMDLGFGDGKEVGCVTAWVVIGLSLLSTVLLGVCLW